MKPWKHEFSTCFSWPFKIVTLSHTQSNSFYVWKCMCLKIIGNQYWTGYSKFYWFEVCPKSILNVNFGIFEFYRLMGNKSLVLKWPMLKITCLWLWLESQTTVRNGLLQIIAEQEYCLERKKFIWNLSWQKNSLNVTAFLHHLINNYSQLH